MIVLSSDNMRIGKELDMVVFRNRLKEFAVKIGMSLVNQTKLITAASELSRNMLRYAGGGAVLIEIVNGQRQNGLRVTFSDTGPGIPDIDKAMKDGFSTGKSLGLGLPGARRLVNDFEIKSTVGKGTTITITKWKNG
ncbi:anti-sigma regulatory factor [Chitinophaga filiformis]|uniref:anti-sigma regulatory factor n=1 Tax=Chitinophaga filiformis TaxID=104663 RepID=UPI001F1D1EC1|nr:anti-sigma regulatory factor [Chitinophaga filiformis]MCF6406017.1 anti-sigma regulatory factor [Chitinophaga filiformis]